MPILNRRAQMLCGIAGQPSSVDGVLLPVGGNADWEDDDTVVGQSLDATAVVAVAIANPTVTLPRAAHPASRCVGGGGKWAAFYQPPAGASQVDGSYGSFPGAYAYAMGPDGTLALKPVYQSGAGLRLIAPNGSMVDVPDANPRDLQVLGPGVAVWSENVGVYRAVGRAVPQPVVATERFRLVTTPDGVEWIVIQGQAGGVFVHRNGATTGYVLVPAGQTAYNVDAAVVNGEIIVVWAVGPGEVPGQGVKVPVDRTQPEVALTAAAPAPTGTASSGTLHALAAQPRKLWLAPFFSISTRYGDTPRDLLLTYANAITIVPDAGNPNAFAADLARAFALGMPIICGAPPDAGPIVAPYIGNIVAWWVSGTDAASVASAVAIAAELPEKPIVAYLDSGDPAAWPTSRPAWVNDRVWPGPQCYRLAGEPVAAFAARMHAMLSRLAAYGVYSILTPRFDDVNGTQPVSFTTDGMDLYAELLQAYPIAGAMPFADRRGHGISADAELLGWAQAFLRANVARPNRYDYWTPAGSSPADTLKNKLAQSIEMVVLSSAEKQLLLERIG